MESASSVFDFSRYIPISVYVHCTLPCCVPFSLKTNFGVSLSKPFTGTLSIPIFVEQTTTTSLKIKPYRLINSVSTYMPMLFLQEMGAATAAVVQSAPSTEGRGKQKLEPYQERMKVSTQ